MKVQYNLALQQSLLTRLARRWNGARAFFLRVCAIKSVDMAPREFLFYVDALKRVCSLPLPPLISAILWFLLEYKSSEQFLILFLAHAVVRGTVVVKLFRAREK